MNSIAKPVSIATPGPEEENLVEVDASASSSTATTSARKRRKVSFAPNPPTSQKDTSSQASPSKETSSTSRRSTRLSRLKDDSEDVNLVEANVAQTKSLVENKVSHSDAMMKLSMTDLDARMTRSKLAAAQEVGGSDDESASSTISSITSGCSHSPLNSDVTVKRRPGRPLGVKNKKGSKKDTKTELEKQLAQPMDSGEIESFDADNLAIAVEFLSKHPVDVQDGGKRRKRRRRIAEVKEATARG